MLFLLASLASAAPGPGLHGQVMGLPHGIDVPCSTPSKWGLNDIDPVWPAVPPPPDGKAVRDAWGEQPFSQESEHFVLKWGGRAPLDDRTAQHLLDAFEAAWAVEIDAMEHQAPYGSDTYLFNVYIGNSANTIPSIQNAAAYYSTDRDGWPMIVVNPNTLNDDQFTDITAAHEFYHAVQGATQRFNYQQNGPSAWFWESTATWASGVVFTENPRYVVFLFGYAFYPHFQVNFFDYPDSGAITEYYQYGAFIFPQAISEETGSWHAIADVWKDTGVSNDPLEVLRYKLEAEGYDLDQLWMRHNARNATWDYRHGDSMRSAVGQMSQYPGYSNMIAGSIPSVGMTEPTRGPSSLAPRRYGYNTFLMIGPVDGDLTVTVDGDATGSSGSPGSYGAYVVRDMGANEREYHEVEFDGTHGELTLEGVGDENRLYLVIGSYTPFLGGAWQSETFGYSYQVSIEQPPEPVIPDPVDDSPRACACDGSANGAGGVAWASILLLALLRRRSSAR